MANQKISFFIKESLSFFAYLVVGFFACLLAFFIAVQFLNPALSEDKNKQADKKGSISSIVKGITKSATDVIKNLNPKKTTTQPVASPAPSKAPSPPSGLPPSKDLPSPPSGKLPPEASSPPSGLPPSADLPSPPSGNLPPEVSSPPSGLSSSSELSSQGGSGSIIEVEKIMSPFIYDPEQRRDPFEDPTKIKESETIVFVPKTPPEEYNLNQVKLKGIIWDTKSPKALFQLPGEGGFYTLLKGDKLGKNGTIFEIREDEVVIVETIIKVTGKAKTETESQVKIIKLDRLRL